MGRCFSCCFVFRSAQRALSRYPFAAGSAPAAAGLPGPLGGGRAWGLSKEFRASKGTLFLSLLCVLLPTSCPVSILVRRWTCPSQSEGEQGCPDWREGRDSTPPLTTACTASWAGSGRTALGSGQGAMSDGTLFLSLLCVLHRRARPVSIPVRRWSCPSHSEGEQGGPACRRGSTPPPEGCTASCVWGGSGAIPQRLTVPWTTGGFEQGARQQGQPRKRRREAILETT